MRKAVLVLSTILSIGVLFQACKKREGDNTKMEGENQTVLDYMSTKEGSWWLYASSDGTVTQRKATGKDSTMLGRKYDYYETTDTATKFITPEYFGKNGDKFFMLVDLDGSQTNYLPLIVNKDEVKLGDKWDNTSDMVYSGMTFNLLAEGEVTAVGQVMTLNGKEYTDVIEVNNKLKAKQATLMPIYISCGSAKLWFKKGVGIIKSDFDISIASVFTKKYTDSLIDYHIEK